MSMIGFRKLEKLIVGVEMNARPTHLLLTHPVIHFRGGFVVLINIIIDTEETFILITREE